MLPAVASILIGGLAHAMASLGLSGVLSQLAETMSTPGAAGQVAAPAPGSGGGVIGSLISMFGGASGLASTRAVTRSSSSAIRRPDRESARDARFANARL